MKTLKMKKLPNFYISKRAYRNGRRGGSPTVIKYVPCRTYTKEQREQYYEEYWNAEYQSTADAAYFRYIYGRPNIILDSLAY